MSKRSNVITILVCVGVTLAAALIVLAVILAPRLTAQKAMRKQCTALREGELTYLSLLDPLDRSGPLLPTDNEIRLTDEEEITAWRDRLLPILEHSRYAGQEEGESGNWDVRLRFLADGEPIDVYLRSDVLYLVRGSVRFLFTPDEVTDFTAFYEEMIALLPANGEGERA